MKKQIPFWNKMNLTIEEASVYSSIGINTIRELLKEPGCPFALRNGRNTLVKRKEFEEYNSRTLYLR